MQICAIFLASNIVQYTFTLLARMIEFEARLNKLVDFFKAECSKLLFIGQTTQKLIPLLITPKLSLILIFPHMKWYLKKNLEYQWIFFRKLLVTKIVSVLVHFADIYQPTLITL